MAELGEHLRGAVGEDDRGLAARRDERLVLHPLAGQDRQQGEGDAGDRDRRADARRGGGGGDQVRGRGLPAGQRRGQRVTAGECRRHREGGGRPLLRVRLEAAEDGTLDGGVEVLDVARGSARQTGRALVDQLRPGARLERAAAGEQLVEDEAESVEVASHRRLAAGELLRRHVGRGPLSGRRAFDRGRPPRQAEVGDPGAPAAVDHDVCRFEVAVDDALIVRRREPGADLPGELRRLVARQSADPEQQRREVLAVHVLHRDEVVPAGVADVVDTADVRVRHPARGAHLVEEQGEPVGIPAEPGRQELERHRLPELEVVGPVDLTHAAPAEKAAHPVAVGDDRARDVALGRRACRAAAAPGTRRHRAGRVLDTAGRIAIDRGLARIVGSRHWKLSINTASLEVSTRT